MNNTTTRRNLTIVAIFMAATLVVGTLAATTITITQTAFAFSKKKEEETKIVEMVIQLPFKNANKQLHRVDLTTIKNKNVKT